MRYLTILGMMLFSLVSFAQTERAYIELKNEGNDALRKNDFATAVEKFEAALAVWPEEEAQDASMIFNLATAARRIKNHEKALEYYKKSVDMGYRADFSTYYIASSLNNLDRDEEMEQTLLKAIEDYKSSSVLAQMKKMLTTYYLKKGAEPYNQAAQILASAASADPEQYDEITARANNAFADAKPWFEKVLEIDPDNEKAQASLREINSRLK